MADEDTATAVAPNTAAQVATHEDAAAAWEKERKQPLWQLVLTGDDAVWVARPGTNVAVEDRHLELQLGDDVVHSGDYAAGDPMPWVAPAKASVQLRAATADQAKARALAHNPEYHTVASCEQIGAGATDDEATA